MEKADEIKILKEGNKLNYGKSKISFNSRNE